MAILLWHLTTLVKALRSRLKNDFDCILAVDGDRGIGKSTISYKICKGVDKKFRPALDIVYSRQEVLKHLEIKHKRSILADEMINVGYNRDFYFADQKNLNKMLNMYRDHNNLFVMCIPSFWDLDPDIRGLVSVRLTVVRRGVAIIQRPVKSLYAKEKWDSAHNEKIEKSWSGDKTKPRYNQLSTYRGILYFHDLNPEQRMRYQAIKDRKRSKVLETEGYLKQDSADPEKLEFENLIKMIKSGGMTEKEVRRIALLKGMGFKKLSNKLNNVLKENKEETNIRELILKSKDLAITRNELKKQTVRI